MYTHRNIMCAYRHSTFSPEAVTLIAVFSNSKELLPVPSVGTHRARRHGARTYVRMNTSRRVWSTVEGRAGREQEGKEAGGKGDGRGKGSETGEKSEKGSHSGQLITRELTRRFQYHFFHSRHQARPIRSLMKVYERLAQALNGNEWTDHGAPRRTLVRQSWKIRIVGGR